MTEVKVKKKRIEKYRPQVSGILDFIAPTALAFNNRDMVAGSQYGATLVITDYPSEAGIAWLSKIVTMSGVSASIHIQQTDAFDLIKSINVSIGEYQSRIYQGGNAIQIQRAEKGLKDAEELLKKIDQEQQQVVYMTVALFISAEHKDELDQRVKRVESRLASSGMRGRLPMFKQEEAYRTVYPANILEPDLMALGARNMPIESVSASYPFVYSGLNDGFGVLLGQDASGGLVLVDIWQRGGDRTNGNMYVMGKPGVGKSTVIKKILLDEYTRGRKIIIIDPEREYKDLCENLEGNWIDCGGGSRGRINPMQVMTVPLDEDDTESNDYMFTEEHIKRGALGLHFQSLRTFFSMYMKDASHILMTFLDRALEDTYNKFGIGWETDISKVTNEEWPNVRDLYDVIEEKAKYSDDREWRELLARLRSCAIGADANLWAGTSSIKADKDFIVLDIHQLLESNEEIRRAQFFNVLTWAWNEIAKDRSEEVILAVDEAYLLVDPETPQALQFLRNTSKRIRKYNGSLMVITHNLVDFLDPAVRRYGQALIDNPAYKLIMGQGEKDIEAMKELMTLSEREEQTLLEGKRGEALFFAGSKRLQVNIEVSPFELEMFGEAGGR